MNKPDLLMIVPMPAAVRAGLEQDFTLHSLADAGSPEALVAKLAPMLRFAATSGHCPAALMGNLPKLEVIASFGVGYDGIDIEAAEARGIRVTNTPDVLNDCVAEVTLGLMIALAHRIPQADRYVREGRWLGGNFPLTAELTGARAGILGLGRIGTAIARRLEAFRMEIAYHGRREQPDVPYRFFPELEAMAREVDWLVVIAPGSATTQGIVSRRVMEALGPEGCLVNVARGSLADEPAMVELLTTGRLGGAALDVFADEPRVPETFFGLDNVVLSPHQGSATHRTRQVECAPAVGQDQAAVLTGLRVLRSSNWMGLR
jgi:lactate dehydrogenase-like 2-hydroxyacid dehydrogenase